MEALLHGIAHHGYSILFAAVFLEAIGFPVPAALALLIAGAASASGDLITALAAASALSALVLGDTCMFLIGKYTGWWLLGLLCRISVNPESCIVSSAASFYRRGRLVLIFAKFIPGINTMAPPLAGSMNMRPAQFLLLDFAGAALYTGVYMAVGYGFSGAIAAVTRGYHLFGRVMGWVAIAAVVGYVGYLTWTWIKDRGRRKVPMASPVEVARALASEGGVIYDVRSHGYYHRETIRIQGSKRLEPNAIHQFEAQEATEQRIYLYCTCLHEATSS